MTGARPGPLAHVRVVELGGIGPTPFCGMVLADLGADVVRIHRPGDVATPPNPVLDRGRRSLAIDLKTTEGAALVRTLIDRSDAVIEGFRPGVAERLGFDPAELRRTNPQLVVGRMTGFGQDGPLAQRAGHDINYIALSGVLGSIGRPDEPPVPPLNLVGDFGGGGMLLALGVLAGVLNARATGIGQDIDAAMVDGSALLMAMIHGFAAQGRWQPSRGTNHLDSGAPYYDTYECADGRFLAVGALEPQFFANLVDVLGLSGRIDLDRQHDPTTWPHQRKLIGESIATLPRDAWARRFAGVDACVTPVLDITEAPVHEHMVARSTFVADAAGVTHPAPAPRFLGTPLAPPSAATKTGEHTDEVLTELGLATDQIATLRAEGTVA